MTINRLLSSTTVVGTLALTMAGQAQAAPAGNELNASELINLSLEQLSNIEVTSVSKRPEKASEAAAAIFVITQDDIKRSGATSIPEVLRIVPGLSVAQSSSHEWAISSRGATGQFANKLLVLMDGRSVYTPLFSGVYWEVQDTLMQDIERIEVIRGPGATLWGANAVNGVINIITKNSKDTQGGLATQTVGNQDRSLSGGRYGVKIGNESYARGYAKYDDRAQYRSTIGGPAGDAWNKGQGGFRSDGVLTSDVSYTLQGDAYRAGESFQRNLPALSAALVTPMRDREIATGGNVLARLNYTQSPTSQWTLQSYFDNMSRENVVFDDNRNTFDLDLQHTYTEIERNEIVWGLDYRLVRDHTQGTRFLNLTPHSRTDNTYSAFIQDKIALAPDRFFLTLGSKFEHNNYTGFEMQPSARLTWVIDSNQTLWSSAARAIRTPNRFSDDGSLALGTTRLGPTTFGFLNSVGNRNLRSERLNAFEAGYRVQPTKTVSFDLAGFYNRYDRLVGNSVGTPRITTFPGSTPFAIIPVTPINGNKARSFGLELASNWEVTDYWKLAGSYTWLTFKRLRPDQLGFTTANAAPVNQGNIRSVLLLPHNLELDNTFYLVDNLSHKSIPGYVRSDVRLAWKALDNLELSLVGQNVLDNQHKEFPAFVYENQSQVPRSVYGNITWKF